MLSKHMKTQKNLTLKFVCTCRLKKTLVLRAHVAKKTLRQKPYNLKAVEGIGALSTPSFSGWFATASWALHNSLPPLQAGQASYTYNPLHVKHIFHFAKENFADTNERINWNLFKCVSLAIALRVLSSSIFDSFCAFDLLSWTSDLRKHKSPNATRKLKAKTMHSEPNAVKIDSLCEQYAESRPSLPTYLLPRLWYLKDGQCLLETEPRTQPIATSSPVLTLQPPILPWFWQLWETKA